MRLSFQLPRYLCSRSFRRLATRSEVKKVMRSADLKAEERYATGLCALQSPLELYIARSKLQQPKAKTMTSKHPVSNLPLWKHILMSLEEPHDEDAIELACTFWPQFVQSLCWWEYNRCFAREGSRVELKRSLDVVIISPLPRLAKVTSPSEYAASCRNALLAL